MMARGGCPSDSDMGRAVMVAVMVVTERRRRLVSCMITLCVERRKKV